MQEYGISHIQTLVLEINQIKNVSLGLIIPPDQPIGGGGGGEYLILVSFFAS